MCISWVKLWSNMLFFISYVHLACHMHRCLLYPNRTCVCVCGGTKWKSGMGVYVCTFVYVCSRVQSCVLILIRVHVHWVCFK